MIKRCQQCDKTFEVDSRYAYKKYCCERCRKRAEIYHKYLHEHFNEEFAAWKRDFIAGKTQSN